jgi:hypothetical protein
MGANVASAVTDRQGQFSVRGLRGGVYEVSSGGSSQAFRVWTASASPPSANESVTIVAGDPVNPPQNYPVNRVQNYPASRGQYYSGPGTPAPITNGQVVLGTLTVAGIIGGIIAFSVSAREKTSGS